MKHQLVDLLEKNNWQPNNVVQDQDAALIENKFNWILPADYAAVLQFSNGGSLYGFETPLIIYPISRVLALYKEYDLYETIPKSLIFGTDGGGTLYAYDLRNDKKEILFFKEDDIHYNNIVYRANNLQQVAKDIIEGKKINRQP